MTQWLNSGRILRSVCWAVWIAVVVCAVCSLSWRYVNDTPIMLYLSNLMVRHHAIPYRDFFDMNLPGSYWMFGMIIRIFGTSDFSMHFANLFVIAAISGLMYWAMSGSCCWGAVLGVGLGALRILSGEWAFVLQRELFALVPVSVLLVLGLRQPIKGVPAAGMVGLLVAWLALIKPQLSLYGIPVALLLVSECENWRQRVHLIALMGCGFLLPVVACGMWLVKNDAWTGFLEVVQYWPLYGQMTHGFEFVSAHERVFALMLGVWKMLCSPYIVVAIYGIYVGWERKSLSAKESFLWLGLLALTVVVPAVSGQFWGYHRLPFFYLALCASGYLVLGRAYAKGLCVLLAVFWISFAGVRVWRETSHPSIVSLKYGVPDAFGDYLKVHLQPGDRVQPVDWACGSLHGMLMVDALPATRFPYSFYFLHHVSHPLIQKLRQEYMDSLKKNPPRFVLEATTVPMPSGMDTEKRFEAFETWRASHYRMVAEDEHYRIWELAEHAELEN